jgi:hypothetical protein
MTLRLLPINDAALSRRTAPVCPEGLFMCYAVRKVNTVTSGGQKVRICGPIIPIPRVV